MNSISIRGTVVERYLRHNKFRALWGQLMEDLLREKVRIIRRGKFCYRPQNFTFVLRQKFVQVYVSHGLSVCCSKELSAATKYRQSVIIDKYYTMLNKKPTRCHLVLYYIYFPFISCSTCFGPPCAHPQELTTWWYFCRVWCSAVAV